MDNIKKHMLIMNNIHETYINKNKAYGNSFDETCNNFGITAAMVRMSDKWNRLKTLTQDNKISCGDESIKDTLLDLANYCVMTYMWLSDKNEDDSELPNKSVLKYTSMRGDE